MKSVLICFSLIIFSVSSNAQYYEGRHKVGVIIGRGVPFGDFKLQKAATVEQVYSRGFAKPGYILGADYSFLLFKHLELHGEFLYTRNRAELEMMQADLNTIQHKAVWTLEGDAWTAMHFYAGIRYKFDLTQNQKLKGFVGIGLGLAHVKAPISSIRMVNDTSDITVSHELISDKIASKAGLGLTYLVGKRICLSAEAGIMYSPAFFANDYSKHFYSWMHPASFKVPYSLATFQLGIAYSWGKNPYVPLWDKGPQKKKTEQKMKRTGRKARLKKSKGDSGL